MKKYIIQRIITLIPVVLGISLIIFLIMDLTPGDPARLILGDGSNEAAILALREELGLNDPLPVRYLHYIWDALHGDFGKSYRTGVPVFQELFARFPTTLRLAFLGISIAVLAGIPVGIISAVKQYSLVDHVSLLCTLLMTSLPGFWLSLMLILVFSVRLGLFPATGIDTWKHFVLPAIATASGTMATLIRMTRSQMLDVIRQDYIRTARSKGAAENRVIFKHALRNALLPVVTVIGTNFGHQLGGTIMIEAVFAIPGLGSLLITSVRMKDTPMVMASIIFISIVSGLVNLAVDLLYTYIDPRVKSTFVKVKG